MTASIIDGKAAAAALRSRVLEAAVAFEARAARRAGLAVVLVGDDPASQVYVRNKVRHTQEAGMASVAHRLPVDTLQDALLALVAQLNGDPAVDGILVQLPLPEHIDEDAIIAAIMPEKDVDGLTDINAGRLVRGAGGLVSCTPLGCLILLKEELGDLEGLDVVVIGRSRLVGKPLAQLLTAADATVTIAHSRTRDLAQIVRRADIVVTAVGRAGFVRGEWIKPGATVIDVGINRIDNGDGTSRIVGDVDFAEAAAHAGAITPVPGGVGPMTIACLLRNTLVAAHAREGFEAPGL